MLRGKWICNRCPLIAALISILLLYYTPFLITIVLLPSFFSFFSFSSLPLVAAQTRWQ